MWVVKHLKLYRKNFPSVNLVTYILSDVVLATTKLEVTICNTETGEFLILESTPANAFFEELNKYNPYGYIKINSCDGEWLFIAIDDLSLQFLELVDQVEDVFVYEGSPVFPELMKVYYGVDGDRCSAVDKAKSLFSVGEGLHGTLLQLMMGKEQCWYNDKYYCYSYRFLSGYFKAYCISFPDVQKAKRFIIKAKLAYGKNRGGG